MQIDEALEKARTWAKRARAMEKASRKGGYDFMASDCGDEADVLEALIEAAEGSRNVAD